MKHPCCENVVLQEVAMKMHPHEYVMTQPSRDWLCVGACLGPAPNCTTLVLLLLRFSEVNMVLTLTLSGQYMMRCNVELVVSLVK